MIDGKVGLCDRTIRTNSRIQRCCQRFDLADVHSVGVFRTFGYVGNLVAAVVQTRLGQGYGIGSIGNGQSVSRQYAVARGNFRRGQSGSGQFAGANGHFVERYVVFSFNRQVFTAAFHSDVLTLFHGHGVAGGDFLAVGLVVRFQVPAFVGSFFNCRNGFVDVVFACATNVVGRYVAVVVGCVAAQDGCQVHLGSIQLRFGRGFV